jgi:hypothetical protein
MNRARVILALGAFARNGCLRALEQLGRYTLPGSYHLSQPNTFTGRLTRAIVHPPVRGGLAS